jgi:hypothetical protein
MRSVCAWCGTLLGDTHASPQGTTHGICVPCDRQLRATELLRVKSEDEFEAECPTLHELIANLSPQPS